MSWEEFRASSPRQTRALWNRVLIRETRAEGRTRLLELQMANLIAMVANTAFRKLWDEWREPTEFLPEGWADANGESETDSLDFDDQVSRAMERASACQNGRE